MVLKLVQIFTTFIDIFEIMMKNIMQPTDIKFAYRLEDAFFRFAWNT